MKNLKHILIILVVFIKIENCDSQTNLTDSFCSEVIVIKDTQIRRYMKDLNRVDTILPTNYKFCYIPHKFGFRIDIGLSGYDYNKEYQNYISNHWGPYVGFFIFYQNFNLGMRVKPWSNDLKKELYPNDTFPKNASLNNPKLDFTLGYSYKIYKKLYIEPYIGLNRNIFIAIDENSKEIEKYDFNTSYGLTSGITLNQYIEQKKYSYFAIFSTIGYSFADFKRTNPNFGVGFLEWNFGVSIKINPKKIIIQKL